MKSFFRFLAFLVLLVVFYILGNVIWATATDFQPRSIKSVEATQTATPAIEADTELSFVIWNVGYGGISANMEFFYDAKHYYTSGEKMVRDLEPNVKRNMTEGTNFIKNTDYDFYLFQEIDINSKRSYGIDQYDLFAKTKPDYSSYFFKNLDVKRIPIPILEPWNVYGNALSGLSTLARFQPSAADRLQLPGKYKWPDRIFQLDRCIGRQTYDLPSGKKLIVLNIHNSAYDKGGFMKKQQMKFFKDLILKEYQAGNYVVAGGDWNQCPPNFSPTHFIKEEIDIKLQSNIEADFLPDGWIWVYDKMIPTNRKTHEKYVEGKSWTTLIDFFLISPNVELVEVKGVHQDFQWSDHQPVAMRVKLIE